LVDKLRTVKLVKRAKSFFAAYVYLYSQQECWFCLPEKVSGTICCPFPTMNRISSLPDEILCSILSFVTTKEAVATSVLSKRWTHLWLSVPNLHFTNINIDTTESKLRFNETVYSVLASREAVGSNFINSFRLDIKYTNSNLANDFEWVNLIVQCKLKYLRLRLHVGEYAVICKLPISILTCKTLVSLNLRWFRLEGFSFTSNEFGFPSLKILHLQIMFFLKVRDFMLLLAKCPILEDLQASRMFFYSQEDSLTIHQEFKSLSLPKLTRANITRCFCLYHPVKALSNTYYLCIDKFKLSVLL